MARRRRITYSRKKRINILPVIIIVFAVAALVVLVMKLFSSKDYISQINYVLSSEIKSISGNITRVSEVDTRVYVNDGIIYTNQHKGKTKINSLDGEKARNLLESLGNLSEEGLVEELPQKQDGYYWLDFDVIIEDNFLLFKNEEEYNFNFYYDIQEEKVYVKEKYYDEFSKKNNKIKLQEYRADDIYKRLIQEVTLE